MKSYAPPSGWVIGLLLMALLAACEPQQPTLAPPGTFVPVERDLPTLPPPPWTEPAEPITLGNAPRIGYLGRLDAPGQPTTIFSYAFSLEGTRLVGLNNSQLVMWNLIDGRILFTTDRDQASFVFYGADKDEVYTLDPAGLIRIYDANLGQKITELPGNPSFNGRYAYYRDEGLLALGGLDGTIKVWDVGERTSLVTIEAHRNQITGLTFTADGTRLASGSDDGTVKLWDWRSRTALQQLQANILHLAFSQDGALLAAGEASRISLWDTAEGRLRATISSGQRSLTDVLLVSPDGEFIVNGGSLPSLTIWDADTGQLVNTLSGLGGDSTSAAFSPNAELLITSTLGGLVSLWDTAQFRSDTLRRGDLNVGTRQILYADWSSDGFLLVLVDASGPIQLWGIQPEPTPTPQG